MRRGVDVAVGLFDSAFFGAPDAAGGLNRDAQRCSRRRTRWTGRWFALMGRTPGNFIAPGVELETRSIGQRSVTALHSFVIALQRPKIFRAEPSIAMGTGSRALSARKQQPVNSCAASRYGVSLIRGFQPVDLLRISWGSGDSASI
jgi:hypothetical protein